MAQKKHKASTRSKPVDLEDLRRLVIVAMFSDDTLMHKLVLKGGNALSLAHNLNTRTSVDVDLSIPADFEDFEDVKNRILRALQDRFDSIELVVFDYKFERKPEFERPGHDPRWGGYGVEFKVATGENYKASDSNIEALRRTSVVVGPSQKRTFTIDISKYEFCEGKTTAEIDHFTIYVYTLEMIAIEKLRAICQQLPKYELRGHATPRARDFYDIHTVISRRGVDLTADESIRLFDPIFAAKQVPLGFLSEITNQREFHRADWDSVVSSADTRLESFDFYFDYVLQLIYQLQSAGIK